MGALPLRRLALAAVSQEEQPVLLLGHILLFLRPSRHGLQGHQAALHLLCCREANTLQQIAQPLSISFIRMEGGSANNSLKAWLL